MTRWPALLLCLLLGKGAADDNASNASENATFDNASASESATVPLCLQGSGFEAVPKDSITFRISTKFDFVVHFSLLGLPAGWCCLHCPWANQFSGAFRTRGASFATIRGKTCLWVCF